MSPTAAGSGVHQGRGGGVAVQGRHYTIRAGTGYDAIDPPAWTPGPAPVREDAGRPRGLPRSPTSSGSCAHRRHVEATRYARAVRAAPCRRRGYGHHVNMEGFMFPATYRSARASRRRRSSRSSWRRSSDDVAKVDMSYASSKNLTPYDVLTIASMIEREARCPGRPREGRRGDLQPPAPRACRSGIDATILYHLGSWTATIHQSDIDSHEPYNTRMHKGLPPTPICKPRPGVAPGRRPPRPT